MGHPLWAIEKTNDKDSCHSGAAVHELTRSWDCQAGEAELDEAANTCIVTYVSHCW